MAITCRVPFVGRLLARAMLWLMLACAPGAALAERIALVVGNARYEHIPSLASPAEDTRAVAEALRRLGFDVTLLSDVSTGMFNAALDEFARDAARAEAVLFYYAGHAFQDGGINRLVPVAARLDRAEALAAETWSMDDIAARIGGSATTLIFLDACRNSPVPDAVRGAGSAAQGLAEFDTPAGTFVAFSTRPGAVSFDRGDGGYSPFAQAFLDHVERPGQSVSDLMINVRNAVEVATVGRQVPWDQSSLRSQFYFAGQDAEPAAASDSYTIAGADVDPAMQALMDEIVPDDTQTLGPAPGNAASAPPSDTQTADNLLPENTGAAPVELPLPAPIRLAAASDRRPAIQAVTGGASATAGAPAVISVTRTAPPPRLAALAAAKASAPVPVAALAAQRPAAAAMGFAPAAAVPVPAVPNAPLLPAPVVGAPVVMVPVPPAPVVAGATVLVPEDLPRALQEELTRVGCYRMTIDGDWGNGSRNAVRRYLDARKAVVTDAALEPTEALWRTLRDEKGEVCAAPPPQPAAAKKAPQKSAPKAAKAPKQAAAPKKKAPAAAEAPKKRKPVCKFVVVAIVCK